MTLVLADGKVYIESSAFVSERFADRINDMLSLN